MSRVDELMSRFVGTDSIVEPESVAGRDRAVLELMLLTMFSDGMSSASERSSILEYSESRPWPLSTNGEVEVEEATARVRDVIASPDRLRDFVRDICVRLDHTEDQSFALDHIVTVAAADGRLDSAELEFIAELRSEFGLPAT